MADKTIFDLTEVTSAGTATLYVRNVRLRYMPKPYGGLTVQIP